MRADLEADDIRFSLAQTAGGYQILAVASPPVTFSADSTSAPSPTCRLLVCDDPSRFARLPHPDAQVESTIDSRWQEQQQRLGKHLWNGSKFRLGAVYTRHDRPTNDHPLCLCLGRTDYRAHQGTTLAPDALRRFRSDVPGAPDCHLANALGNAAVVITADDNVVCQRRRDSIGEAGGRWVLPGGHPEPANVDTDAGTAPRRTVERELFESVADEVREELAVPAEALSPVAFLGVVRRVADHRVTYAAQLHTTLTTEQVRAHWQRGDRDLIESVDLRFLPVRATDDIADACGWNGADAARRLDMAEDHRGALCLFLLSQNFPRWMPALPHQSPHREP
ncbi:hypothetical protein CDCA_CDCA09G2850 [Cyanidium caldarium]|uniref:Nudix hydrolase domain-containing protein n=1 Tax=Cyanidium caldarium TaxID=2771 RepID=A0AAV9IWW9_CYACA|nr:hypothetical protein CDCA_CDCA09G2850 [Cyanidium caldarium]